MAADPSQQLQQLQARYQQLEADVKATHETVQKGIKQNRQTWLALKQENKELKAEMSQRGGGLATGLDSRGKADRTIEKLEKDVHELRRQHDRLLQEKKSVITKLENLQDSIQELHKASGIHDPGTVLQQQPTGTLSASSSRTSVASSALSSREARELRQLENRLDKALIKCNEAQSIRHTYEQVLDKMKKEQLGFDTHIKALEDAIQAVRTELDTAGSAHRDVQRAKEAALRELASVEEQVARERAAREAKLADHRATTLTLSETNTSLLARQFAAGNVLGPKKPTVLGTASAEESSSLASATSLGEVALSESSSTSMWGQHKQQQGADAAGPVTLTPEQEEAELIAAAVAMRPSPVVSSLPVPDIADAAEAVTALCEAASSSSLQALVDKLVGQQDNLRSLSGLKAKALKQVETASAEVARAHATLEEVRTGGKHTTQRQLDAAQAELREAAAAVEAAREAHDQVLKVYVDMRSGVEHLASMVAILPLPPGQLPVPISDETLGDVLAQCQQRLTAGVTFIQTLPKAAALLEGMMSNPDFSFETPALGSSASSTSSL